MRKFFTTIKRIFTIPELRSRILTTLGLLLIFRLGAFIVLPGIDATKITGKAQGILGLLDIFLGGAFSNVSIFGLGVMPYISASIAVQLLTVAVKEKDNPAEKRLIKLPKYLRLELRWSSQLATLLLLCLMN